MENMADPASLSGLDDRERGGLILTALAQAITLAGEVPGARVVEIA